MPEVISPLEAKKSATPLNALAAVLILLALIAPFQFITNVGDAAVGRIAETLGTMLIPFGLAWQLTKNSTEHAKAKGRTIAAAVVCLVVGNGVYRSMHEEDQTKDFLRAVMQHSQKQMVPFQELSARFDAVDFSTVLTPEAIVTAKGRDAAREAVRNYKALIAERQTMLKAHSATNAKFIQENAPNERLQRVALSGMEHTQTRTDAIMKELDKAQTELSDALTELLDWTATQQGKLGAKDGKFLFSTEDQHARMLAYLARINAADKTIDAAWKAVQGEAAVVDISRQQATEYIK